LDNKEQTMANRGQITENIKKTSARLLGYEITQAELRLMPYVQYVMVNGQIIEPRKINSEERQILSKWRAKGWIEGGASGLSMTKEFFCAICEIIWLSYVAFESEDVSISA
jgi:hypothetical protein